MKKKKPLNIYQSLHEIETSYEEMEDRVYFLEKENAKLQDKVDIDLVSEIEDLKEEINQWQSMYEELMEKQIIKGAKPHDEHESRD